MGDVVCGFGLHLMLRRGEGEGLGSRDGMEYLKRWHKYLAAAAFELSVCDHREWSRRG